MLMLSLLQVIAEALHAGFVGGSEELQHRDHTTILEYEVRYAAQRTACSASAVMHVVGLTISDNNDDDEASPTCRTLQGVAPAWRPTTDCRATSLWGN